MKFIAEMQEGSRIQDVYLCKHKQAAVTKNGKSYENVVLQDRTGQLDCKIWDLNSAGIGDFDVLDYIYVVGSVNSFNGALQGNIRQVRRAQEGEYIPADYLPVTSKNRKQMYTELMKYKDSVTDEYLHALLNVFFEDRDFMRRFYGHSAAKSIHHSFVGGLLEHTLSVVRICDFMSRCYPVLRRDLLVSTAMLHDIGKTQELSEFPLNEYTDEGQLLGHIMIGSEMVHDAIRTIPGFPAVLETEVKHCILAHHGEYEFGSPKKPAIVEAMALNMADNMDAKMESWTEVLAAAGDNDGWLGFNRVFDSNIRKTLSGRREESIGTPLPVPDL